MKASEFETLHLMPRQGWLANRPGAQYHYTINFWPAPHARDDLYSWTRWNMSEKLPFTGTVEEARAAAAAFHQLMCIKHELEE